MGLLKIALYPRGRPDFVAAITFELWKNNTEHYVKVLYRQSTENNDFIDLTPEIESCKNLDSCDINVLEKALEAFQTEHPELLCEDQWFTNESSKNSGIQAITAFFMLFTFLFATLFVISLVLLMRHRLRINPNIESSKPSQ
ncbi:hypothetical protein DICVIV_04534 [Dictyocaulus viviparus]|uniref:Uncharacterized protein n=1 Tax=Dictyocaulus viviparus TaxID=29172 RepID=A0A0D8Y444_DICVI|nr:hypothetical protein DICVIV_04534 [Dictyocaulus viviparus]